MLNGNRLADVIEIEKIADMQNLVELHLASTPMARKAMYRVGVIKRMP
jgi:hypothetical protein